MSKINNDIERRTLPAAVGLKILRAEDGKPGRTIEGYAAVFNEFSQNLGGFVERIEPGAFSEVLDDDVRALFNHDSNKILARTVPGTLTLSVDERGLKYSFEAPDSVTGNDLLESIRRGDIDGSSFGFTIDENDWVDEEDGRTIHVIKKIKRLYDVGPVTFPAYTQTAATARSLENHKRQRDPAAVRAAARRRFLQLKAAKS